MLSTSSTPPRWPSASATSTWLRPSPTSPPSGCCRNGRCAASRLSEQLQRLTSRVVIEQAKGAVAERAAVDMDTAFGWLRGYARANRRLADVAIAVVERTLAVGALRVRPTGRPGVR